jgi:hypothetical protein
MIWLLFGFGCTQNLPYNALFNGPSSSTVVPAETGVWEQPLGFVANRRSGIVTPLDLQHNSPLSDQLSAPFLRPRGVALGKMRQIADIHVDVPIEDQLTIFAIDQYSQSLVIAPYILGMESEPQVVSPSFSGITFEDNDNSGDAPTLTIDRLMPGATTTEKWTITWSDRSEGWLVTGSQSGRQENILTTGTAYTSDFEEISISIEGAASNGDTFTFETDTQIQEINLGGTPLALQNLNDEHVLITLWDNESNQSWISVFNKPQRTEIGRWIAPDDAQLGVMTLLDEQIWVADQQSNRLFVVDLDPGDISNSTHSEITTLGSISDLSVLNTPEYTHVYVATEQRIDVWDVNASKWKNINPLDSFRGGIDLNSPIVGLSSSQRAIDLQTTSAWLAPKQDHVVVATLFNGSTVMLEGETGCIATVPGGSSLSLDGTAYGEIQFNDTGPTSNPQVYVSNDGTMLTTSNCGGVLLDEDWTVTYDGRSGDWLVEGSRSGEQANRALLDERYIVDNGAFSFLLLNGGLPPTDGDQFVFSTLSNILELSLVTNTAGSTEALEVPAAPVTFTDYPDEEGGWENATPNQYALIPITNTNVVIRLNLETWIVEHVWN